MNGRCADVARPFMTDSALLASLDGQQYLVLRPQGEIEALWDASRESLRRSIPQAVAYPNTGHVTLRGFFEPNRVDALKEILAVWAKGQAPIELRVDAIDGFHPPFQVMIARLTRTPSLVDSYSDLTALLDSTDFQRIGELPLEQWVFHLSLIYASSLDELNWHALHERSQRTLEPQPREIITSADFVWYSGGIEHVETLRFGTHPTNDARRSAATGERA